MGEVPLHEARTKTVLAREEMAPAQHRVIAPIGGYRVASLIRNTHPPRITIGLQA